MSVNTDTELSRLRKENDELVVRVAALEDRIAPGVAGAGSMPPGTPPDAAELLYRTVFDSTADGVFLLDATGFLDCNESGARMYNLPKEKVIGSTPLDFSPERQPDGSLSAALFLEKVSAARCGSVQEFEWVSQRSDGSFFDVAITLNLMGDSGNPLLVAVVRDITERKRLMDSLTQSEERFRSLFNASLDAIMVHRQGVILDANPAFVRLFGYEQPEDLIGVDASQTLLVPESLALLRQRNEQQLRGSLEATGIRRDGSTFVAESESRTMTYGGGAAKIVSCRDITASRRAEEALRQSEEQYRTLFETMHSGFILGEVIFDGEGKPIDHRFVQGNAEFEVQTGLQLSQEIGRTSADLSFKWPPDVTRRYYQAAIDGQSFSYERFNDSLGRYYDIRVFSPRRGQFALLFNDITERKRAEAALHEALQFNHQVLDSAREGIVVCGPDLRYRVWNRYMEELTGVAAIDILGLKPAEVFPFLVEAGLIRRHENALAGEVSEEYEVPYSLPDGRSGWTSNLSVPLRNEAGEIVGVIDTVRDITDRKRAEEELAASEIRYRTLFEAANDAIFLHGVAADGMPDKFVAVNNVAIERLGYSAEEFAAMAPADIDAEGFEDARRLTAETIRKEGHATFEMFHVAKNGRRIPVEISSRQFVQGARTFILSICRDLTERKRAEAEREKLQAQLAQAQKMESIGRLAGGVAHDFNNQLTVIMGYSKMALAELPADDPLRDQLEEILKAGERAAGLTRQLLAFSRKQVLEPRNLNLNSVVEDMRKMLERLVGEDVEVRFALSPESPKVHTDPHQLEQVIMNLAVNARDAMPRGGRLIIETEIVERDESYAARHLGARAGHFAMLAVSDTGVGMDEATRQKIFEPFFTTKGPGQGTGLGLSMVQGIVAQSGGYIDVYSEPGQGTTFKIHLPRLAGHTAEVEKPAAVLDLRGEETVLVVEDQAEVRHYVVATLEGYGYRVLPASTAGEALTICERERAPIHLVLSDVVMPRMSGRELVERVAKIRPGTKALFMSGYTDELIVQHGVLNQGVSFIQKPFGPEELAAKVREMLGRPAAAARILVVDDEAGVRSFLRTALEGRGYAVSEAAEGKEGQRQALAGKADLVIMDLVMPGQEGLETIQALHRQMPGLRIIAISGAFEGEFLKVAQIMGADAVLYKPVSAEVLLAKVAEVLSRRR